MPVGGTGRGHQDQILQEPTPLGGPILRMPEDFRRIGPRDPLGGILGNFGSIAHGVHLPEGGFYGNQGIWGSSPGKALSPILRSSPGFAILRRVWREVQAALCTPQ